MRWVQSTEEERKAWGAQMASARKAKGYKHTSEHREKIRVALKESYRKKKESGWTGHKSYARRDSQEIALNHVYRQYVSLSKLRGFGQIGLTRDQVKVLIEQECFYCGAAPNVRTVILSHYPVQIAANGIDRLDNEKAYIFDNCVPCCRPCNLMKNKHGMKDFLARVERIYKRLCL
jgi:hypothetical protein